MARSRRSVLLLASALICAACAAEPVNDNRGASGSAAQAGGGAGGNDFGNVNPMGGAGGAAGVPSGGNGGVASDGSLPTACAGDTQRAERVEIDMYVMLDRSGSMMGLTSDGTTKWDAVRTALTAFARDPSSAGLGVGLQYFPIGRPGVPELCTSDSECAEAEGGECLNRACLPDFLSTEVVRCRSVLDCPAASPGCEPVGFCSLDTRFVCFDFGPTGCDIDGACEVAVSECSGYASCLLADYASPDVPIATLPENATAFVDSLMNAHTAGFTPTSPAIEGAIERAAAQALARPERRSVVVLATDGLPTDCAPAGTATVEQAVQAVADSAARGLAGDPSIRTYVIGVFAPEETPALENLELMARAGGSERAFIVDATGDVATQFLDALAEIRAGTLQCELLIPQPPEGQELDFGLVNIELTASGQTRTLLYVEDASGCAAAGLGWYYDQNPASGGTPTTIRICDQSCAELKAVGSDATLEVRLGCASLRPD
jgi:Mg-chelatase subunit ChlD